ncbi:unnamed protein product [Lupinus luteus]|uniref:Uncharacterized protein n=1 Tax=Lupinus luteus TaxID=3873 RepID=A0AAV1XK38_LUPLU
MMRADGSSTFSVINGKSMSTELARELMDIIVMNGFNRLYTDIPLMRMKKFLWREIINNIIKVNKGIIVYSKSTSNGIQKCGTLMDMRGKTLCNIIK